MTSLLLLSVTYMKYEWLNVTHSILILIFLIWFERFITIWGHNTENYLISNSWNRHSSFPLDFEAGFPGRLTSFPLDHCLCVGASDWSVQPTATSGSQSEPRLQNPRPRHDWRTTGGPSLECWQWTWSQACTSSPLTTTNNPNKPHHERMHLHPRWTGNITTL